jgi:hypothetical protein
MLNPPLSTPSARLRPSPARLAVAVVGGVIVVSQWVRVMIAPGGDFNLHWVFGQRFLAREFLYNKNTHLPYPPFWGMAASPMTVVPMWWAQPILYPFGILALAVLTFVLARLSRRALPLAREPLFWATALGMVLASRFLIREIAESGPNLLMVTLAWVALALWRRGRDTLGGAALGLAIAMKCTPALFVAYFALKRQWRMVAASTLFAALFTLAPLAWQGPSSYLMHMRIWVGNASRGLAEKDPTVGVLGDEEVKNVALRPVLGRLLVRLPEGHLGRVGSRWQLEGLGVPPVTAGLIVKAIMALLLAGIAWTFRRPARDRRDFAIVWEAATVSLLLLLYSPLTWKQHCVGAFPAFYLIARTAIARRGLPVWMLGCLGVYTILVLGLDRGVVGVVGTAVLDSWGVTTWTLLLILAIALRLRAEVVSAPEASELSAVPRPHVRAVPLVLSDKNA